MKKFFLVVTLLISTSLINAQEPIVWHIETCPSDTALCYVDGRPIWIYGQTNCHEFMWTVNNQHFWDSCIIINPQSNHVFNVHYGSECTKLVRDIYITYKDYAVPNSIIHDKWKHIGEIETLEAVGIDSTGSYYGYGFLWNTGETTRTINVTEPGTYTCEISHACGLATRTFIVRDKVEIYRATIDLETNLNKVTWPIIPGQDEYISEVKVYRDGLYVGTAPYEQGYFLDNIGSDNAARNYHLVAVTTDGEESPVSFQKGTIHTTYYEDVNGNLNMTWNIPYVEEGAQGTLTYFQVCKYDPNTGDLTVVDQVNSLITDYTCGVNQFEGGYPVIAAVFNDAKHRDYEDLSFSNMYTDIAIQPQEITINLEPGWTWFSYPYAVSKTLDEALVGFAPVSGDIIVSQSEGTTSFVNGRWRGALTQFTPGLGYMYYSSRSESAPLVFDLTTSRALVKP